MPQAHENDSTPAKSRTRLIGGAANAWRRVCAAGFDPLAAVRDYWKADSGVRSIRVDVSSTSPGRHYVKVALVVCGDGEYIIGSCTSIDRADSEVIALLCAFTRSQVDGLPGADCRDEDEAVRQVVKAHVAKLRRDSTPEPDAPQVAGGLAVRECSPGRLVAHPKVPPDYVGSECRVNFIRDNEATITVEIYGGRVPMELIAHVPLEAIALDLSHETGRQHAALYCFEHGPDHLFQPDYLVVYNAACGRPCDVARLRSLVENTAARLEAEAESAGHRAEEWRDPGEARVFIDEFKGLGGMTRSEVTNG